jgi:hypothetical protein
VLQRHVNVSAYAGFILTYVLSVCFFLKMDMDLRTINAIKNCFTVCSHLDTFACSSCESRMV